MAKEGVAKKSGCAVIEGGMRGKREEYFCILMWHSHLARYYLSIHAVTDLHHWTNKGTVLEQLSPYVQEIWAIGGMGGSCYF